MESTRRSRCSRLGLLVGASCWSSLANAACDATVVYLPGRTCAESALVEGLEGLCDDLVLKDGSSGAVVDVTDVKRKIVFNALIEIGGLVPRPVAIAPAGGRWGRDRVDQCDRWSPPENQPSLFGTAGAGTTVYIVDSGVDPRHDAFGGRVVARFGAGECAPSGCDAHGTHMAGLAGGVGLGAAEAATIVPMVVLRLHRGCVDDISRALLEIVAGNRERPRSAVVSLSLEVADAQVESEWWAILDAQVANLVAMGIVTVVASGNDPQPCRQPERCDDFRDLGTAIVVGPIDSADNPSWASGPAEGRTAIELYAPGKGVRTTDVVAKSGRPSDPPYLANGASAATALVSGVVAVDLANANEPDPQKRAEGVIDNLLHRASNQANGVPILCAATTADPKMPCPPSTAAAPCP